MNRNKILQERESEEVISAIFATSASKINKIVLVMTLQFTNKPHYFCAVY